VAKIKIKNMKIKQLLSKKVLSFACIIFAVLCGFLLLSASNNNDAVFNSAQEQVMGVKMAVSNNGGDVNNDGVVNLTDSLMVSFYLNGIVDLEQSALDNADVNGDGLITKIDAYIILLYDTGSVSSLPQVATKYGDVDNDDLVNSTDANRILAYANNSSNYSVIPNFANADVNLDGSITSEDSSNILEFDVGILKRLPICPQTGCLFRPIFTNRPVGKPKLNLSANNPASATVAVGTTKQLFGNFILDASGSSEDIKVTEFKITHQASKPSDHQYITGIRLYDYDTLLNNGDIENGDPPEFNSGTIVITLDNPLIISKGTSKTISIKGDISASIEDGVTHRFVISNQEGVTSYGNSSNDLVVETGNFPLNGTLILVSTPSEGDPKLNLSVNNPANVTVAAGTTKQLFGNFVLDASSSGEDIKVTQFRFTHQASKAGIHSYVTGITLYDGSTVLNIPKSGGKNTGSTQTTLTITLTNPLIISKGTAKTISIKADISGSAENGTTHKFIINNDAGVLSFGNSSNNAVTETGNFPLNGTLVTIAGSGALNLSNAGSNPVMGAVIADTTQIIGEFDFKALYEDIELEKMGLTITPNKYINIDWLQLYDGSTKLGEIQITGNNATITPSNLIIPQNTTKTLTLKAATHKVGSLESGTSGDNFAVAVTDVDAKGVNTGSTSITVNGLNTTKTNAQYIYKTTPTITKIHLSGMANGTQDLYKFIATANSKGDVGLYKFTFSIDKDSVDVYNLELYETGGLTETILTTNPVSISNNLVEMYIRDKEYVIVPAGNTKTFVLRGDVTGWDSNAILITKHLGDGGNVLTPDTASVVDNNSNNNFIWSDLSAGSVDALNLNQWTNGALVFPTPSAQPLSQTPLPTFTPTPSPQFSLQQPPSAVANHTAGFILLHVEQGGAISYVDKIEKKRYAVTWTTAMLIFESFAIGITDEDLLNIPVNTSSINPSLDTDGDGFTDISELSNGFSPYIPGEYEGGFSIDNNLANRLRGEFLLQVEQGGAIWYVDQDGIRHNVRWDNLMSIFQSLALGINNENLGQIQQGN